MCYIALYLQHIRQYNNFFILRSDSANLPRIILFVVLKIIFQFLYYVMQVYLSFLLFFILKSKPLTVSWVLQVELLLAILHQFQGQVYLHQISFWFLNFSVHTAVFLHRFIFSTYLISFSELNTYSFLDFHLLIFLIFPSEIQNMHFKVWQYCFHQLISLLISLRY